VLTGVVEERLGGVGLTVSDVRAVGAVGER
jgi:hypothetical protein